MRAGGGERLVTYWREGWDPCASGRGGSLVTYGRESWNPREGVRYGTLVREGRMGPSWWTLVRAGGVRPSSRTVGLSFGGEGWTLCASGRDVTLVTYRGQGGHETQLLWGGACHPPTFEKHQLGPRGRDEADRLAGRREGERVGGDDAAWVQLGDCLQFGPCLEPPTQVPPPSV